MGRLKGKIEFAKKMLKDEIVIFKTKKPKKLKDDLAKVIIIKMDALGDGVLWLDSGIRLRKHFEDQGKQVFLVCNKNMTDFYEKYAGFSNFIKVDVSRIYEVNYRRELVEKLREYHYELLINALYSRCERFDDFIAKAISADKKVAVKGDRTNRLTSRLNMDKVYDTVFPNSKAVSENIINYNLLGNLSLSVNAKLPNMTTFVNKVEYKPYVVFGVGASNPSRIWPLKYFAEVATHIITKYGVDIRIVGSPNESKYANEIIALANNNLKIIDMCGKTDFGQLIDIIGNAKFAISNDTGTAHLIGATRVDGVVILGGGNGDRFFPHISNGGEISKLRVASINADCKECAWLCKKPLVDGVWECVASIPVGMIIDMVDTFFSNTKYKN